MSGRANVNISEGTGRIRNVPLVQRGQWKKDLVERIPFKPNFYDPKNEGLGRVKQESRYWCLINLNKAVPDEQDAAQVMSDVLYAIVDRMRTDYRVWLQIFEFAPDELRLPDNIKQVFRKDRLLLMNPGRVRDVIREIKVDNFVVERGKKRGRVHCHFKFEIFHNSCLRLNFRRMPDILLQIYSGSLPSDTPTNSDLRYGLNRAGQPSRPLFWARLLHETNFERVSTAYNNKDARDNTMPLPKKPKPAPNWARDTANEVAPNLGESDRDTIR